MNPGAGPFWTPGAWLAGFHKEYHNSLLYTKYESSGPYGFWEEDLVCFSHDMVCMDPRDTVCMIYKEYHITLLYTTLWAL